MGEWPGSDFLEALPYFREILIKNNGTRGFDSWIVVLNDTGEIVGGIGFLGNPNEYGMIEIGFATNESHRRRGYCLEAAQNLIDWAIHNDEVELITARSETDNIGSKIILSKLGFKVVNKDEKMLHWVYKMKEEK